MVAVSGKGEWHEDDGDAKAPGLMVDHEAVLIDGDVPSMPGKPGVYMTLPSGVAFHACSNACHPPTGSSHIFRSLTTRS